MPKGSGFDNFILNKSGPSKAYFNAVIADSPRGYWRLDEASGNFADSAPGTPHPGTANGGITYSAAGAPKDENKAITLDGTTGYVTVADHADFDNGDVFTLEAWVKRAGTIPATMVILEKGTGSYRLELDTPTGAIAFWVLTVGRLALSTSNVPNDGAFHHIVATKNGTSVHIYLDSVDVTGTVTNQTVTNNSFNVGIGASPGGGLYFGGSIDEVAIYPTELSAARVLAHYQAQIGVGTVGAGFKNAILNKTGGGVAGGVGTGASASVFVKSGSGTAGRSDVENFTLATTVDDFNRADGALTSPWINPAYGFVNQMDIVSNQVTSHSAQATSHYTGIGPFGDCFAILDVPTLPSAGNVAGLWIRMSTDSGNIAHGYRCRIIPFGPTFEIRRLDPTTNTIASWTQAFSAGDSFAMSAVGTSISLWYKPAAGSWILVGSVTDTNWGRGYFGISCGDTTQRIDNFRGGQWVQGLFGSGSKNVVLNKTGAGIAGCVATGASESVFVKSGLGVAGTVGSGILDSVLGKTGFGTVGGVGSGASVKIAGGGTTYTKAGYSVAGTVGAGPSASIFDKNSPNNLGSVPRSNFFINPDVEVDLTRWAGWGSGITRSNAQANTGSWSVRATGVLNGYGCVIGADTSTYPVITPAQSIPVDPNTAYTWSVWVRSDNGGLYDLIFQEYDAAGAQVTSNLTQINCPAGVWTQITVSAVTNANTRCAWANIINGSAPTDAFYADTARFSLVAPYPSVGINGSGTSASVFAKSGYAVAGTVGAGASASVFAKSGYATVGGVGSGPSASVTQETGFGTVGGIGAGASASVFVKSGYATVGCVGSSPSDSVYVESGYGTVGGVGSGARAGIKVKSGYATVGCVASGPSESITVETGFGVVGTVGSGAKVFVSGAGNVYTKAGYGVAGTVGTGADVDIDVETGYATVGTVGAGASASVFVKSGYATVGDVGSGADVDIAAESGFGKVGTFGTGADVDIATETGYATVGGIGAGSSASTTTESGTGIVGGVGAGASASIFVKAGYAVVGTVGAGFRNVVDVNTGFATVGANGAGSAFKAGQVTKTGLGVVGTVGAGYDNFVLGRKNFGTVGGVGSGSRSIVHTKSGFATVGGVGTGSSTSDTTDTGFGVVGTVGAGTSASVTAETGFGVAGTVGAGPSASITQETGFGKVGTIGAGYAVKAGTYTKSGFARVGTVGAGQASKEAQSKSGYATVGTVGSGSKLKSVTYLKRGYAVVGCDAYGTHTSVYVESGFGVVGTTANGSGFAIPGQFPEPAHAIIFRVSTPVGTLKQQVPALYIGAGTVGVLKKQVPAHGVIEKEVVSG